MIKYLTLCLILLFSNLTFSQTPVGPETSFTDTGHSIVRFYNQTPYTYSCWYRDRVNFIVFTLYPYSVTDWQIMYSEFQWECHGV